MIEIDGSFGEGGGGILRNAITFSLLTQKPFRIVNIRKNRPKKGLAHQHLKCLELAKLVSNSKITGASIGSSQVEFFPEKIQKGGTYTLDIKTAGAITLLLQSVFLPCYLSGHRFKFKIIGGTDVPFSPGCDFFKQIYLSNFNFKNMKFEINRRGYYPKGFGEVDFSFQSNKTSNTQELNFRDRGRLQTLRSQAHASFELQKLEVLENLNSALNVYLSDLEAPRLNQNVYSHSLSQGSGLLLKAQFENFNIGISKIHSDIDYLAKNSSKEMIELLNTGEGVDHYLADQLIPLLATQKGVIQSDKITNHIISAIYTAEKFLDIKIKIDKKNCEISKI